MTWNRIARRIRVPLGFIFAVFFLWLARPTLAYLAASLALVTPGLWLRGYASGYVKKNAELTATGPYAHTRNPLYLGSMLIAFGFALAAGSIWIAIALAALFVAVYLPVIRSEEQYLRSVFPGFDAYAARVPRLLPRLTRVTGTVASASFSGALYRKHREYNALIGSVSLYAALILKWIFLK
ncbi:MAG TPA: isoprenylcysteine carboxylmethyltransferase family protein [Acidobacteriaceae bacterium]|jgi:protein-S-isoprenylcysteine O-methyltransferase Ste14|nr:isoprenylcysteine carboxylmethyltransferase family protein [Acidobacteriaceae bacterium]